MAWRPFAQLGAALALTWAVARKFQTSSAPTATATYRCYAGVRTNVADRPAAQCFDVRDGVFVDVYTEDELAAVLAEHNSSGATVERDETSFVIPGLWDGHGHLLQHGEFLHSVDLFGADSFEEVRKRIDEYVGRHPGAGSASSWIRGVGWDQVLLGRMPTADDLYSKSLANLYIMLDRTDTHCNWISHPILSLLSPADLDQPVPGGEIIHEPGMGVFCDNAMDLVLAKWPAPTRAVSAQFAKTAMAALNAVGIVGIHDALALAKDIALFDELADSHDLTLRLYAMLKCDVMNAFCIDDATKINRADGMLSARSVKLFGDGALGSWGAAMLDPYSDKPGTSGTLISNASALTAVAEAWARAGYQVNIHAIGDLANRIAVDALENALRMLSSDDDYSVEALAKTQDNARFRIEHAQIIHPADQDRIRALRIIPSIQPTHATSDMSYAHARLGTVRMAESAYRMRSIADLGLCLGSDFPVEPPSPFRGMYAAVTRRNPATGLGIVDGEGDYMVGWHVEETISLEQALKGFTTNVAWAGFMEGKAGIIAPGAWADWVVLDEDLFEMDIERLRTLAVKETWVGGKKVFPVDKAPADRGWLRLKEYL